MKTIKKVTFFLLIIIITSCQKDESQDVIPEEENIGIIEKFVTKDPEITIDKATNSVAVIEPGEPAYWGYIFSPLTDIQITAIGGRIAQIGEYKIELIQLQNQYRSVLRIDTLLNEKIIINNPEKFQFQDLNEEVTLTKDNRYLIIYFTENNDALYDVVLPESYLTDKQLQPKKIEDIEIECMYKSTFFEFNGVLYLNKERTSSSTLLFIRGLLDFKYK